MVLQDGNLTVESGKKIWIHLLAIHRTQVQSNEIWSFMCFINTGDISVQLQHSQPYLENFF